MTKLNVDIWGPQYWFVLHTIAYNYPDNPNATTKRKYYDLIQNLPLFLPDDEIGNNFCQIINLYPVSPYLDNRESFIRWMNFIHNKINIILGKEELSLKESIEKYKNNYKTKTIILYETIKVRQQIIYSLFILVIFIYILVLK